MKKKIFSLAMVAVLAAVAIVGASLAYFTDTDKATNTFTVGGVDIELLESQYHRVNAGRGNAVGLIEPTLGGYIWAADVELEGTETNTPDKTIGGANWNGLYFSDAQIEADAATYMEEYFAEKAAEVMPGSNIRKNPYVKNTGKSDAYVRVRVLVPVSLFKVLDEGPSYWVDSALESGITSEAVDAYNTSGGWQSFYNGTATDFIVGKDEIDYYEFDFTYDDILKPGAITFWNVWSNIAIDKFATAEDLAEVDSFSIIIEADAIQAAGFANATAAFAAFDAQ